MSSWRVIRRRDYRSLPWKNGRGRTEEIAIFPQNADFSRGDFLWRVSSAPVEENTTFSFFPDHDRVLVILSGSGVRLNGKLIRPLEPHSFSGADESRCELIDGAVKDLSVFIRKGGPKAQVELMRIFDGSAWKPRAEWEFLFVARGELQVAADSETSLLHERDTMAWTRSSNTHDREPSLRLAGSPGTQVLRISLEEG